MLLQGKSSVITTCRPSIYGPSADIDSSGRAFYRVAPGKIDTPLKKLGEVPMAALRDTVLALDIIRPHRDSHTSSHHSHRIHIPLSTNPRVRFMIDGRPYKIEVGQAYEINNQLIHSVMNKGAEDRITYIFDDNEHLFDCLSMGAQGYLLKGHQQEEIVEFLQGILDGRPPLSPSIAQEILKHFHRVTLPEDKQASSLTDRELEVLQLIAKGCHVKEVAEMLRIANSTVSAHIKKIYQKLDIHNRAEATAAAVNLNLISP